MKKFILISLLVIPFCKAADGGEVSQIKVSAFADYERSGYHMQIPKTLYFNVDLNTETIAGLKTNILEKFKEIDLPEQGRGLSIKNLYFEDSGDLSKGDNLLDKEPGNTLHQAGVGEHDVIHVYLKQAGSEID